MPAMQFEKRNRDKEREPRKSSFAVYAVWLARNVLFMGLALLLVKYVLTEQPAYRWVYRELLKKNMEAIKKYPDLTFEQKMQMKLGVDYEYLLFIRQATPENAVILYPSAEAFRKKGSPFKQEIYNKLYATRFLYPRRLVSEDELQDGVYAGKITHVAIVNGEGADKLPYPVDPDIRHGVLPVLQRKKQ